MRKILCLLTVLMLCGCSPEFSVTRKSRKVDVPPPPIIDPTEDLMELKGSIAGLQGSLEEIRDQLRVKRETGRNPRILMFVTSTCSECIRVRRNAIPPLVASGWEVGSGPTNHIQYVYDDSIEGVELKSEIGPRPVMVLIESGKEIARKTGNFTTNSIADLLNKKEVTSTGMGSSKMMIRGGYPLRSNYGRNMNVGSWQHLTHGEHRGKYDSGWLQTLSWPELQSLHSDDHFGTVHWEYVVRPVTGSRRTLKNSTVIVADSTPTTYTTRTYSTVRTVGPIGRIVRGVCLECQ